MPGSTPGDQLVELSIRAPAAASEEERKAYEALRDAFGGYDPRS